MPTNCMDAARAEVWGPLGGTVTTVRGNVRKFVVTRQSGQESGGIWNRARCSAPVRANRLALCAHRRRPLSADCFVGGNGQLPRCFRHHWLLQRFASLWSICGAASRPPADHRVKLDRNGSLWSSRHPGECVDDNRWPTRCALMALEWQQQCRLQ